MIFYFSTQFIFSYHFTLCLCIKVFSVFSSLFSCKISFSLSCHWHLFGASMVQGHQVTGGAPWGTPPGAPRLHPPGSSVAPAWLHSLGLSSRSGVEQARRQHQAPVTVLVKLNLPCCYVVTESCIECVHSEYQTRVGWLSAAACSSLKVHFFALNCCLSSGADCMWEEGGDELLTAQPSR